MSQATIAHGRRMSTARCYLDPVRHRGNLHIETEALTERLLQTISLSLLLKRFDAIGDRNPTLRTLHPDVEFWSEPVCVIKSAGFDGNDVLCGLQNMIDADAALRAEHACDFVATVGDTAELLRHAGHCHAVPLYWHGHAECAARLALTFFAVAGEQAYWFRGHHVTH
jgi:hypothetical protein